MNRNALILLSFFLVGGVLLERQMPPSLNLAAHRPAVESLVSIMLKQSQIR